MNATLLLFKADYSSGRFLLQTKFIDLDCTYLNLRPHWNHYGQNRSFSISIRVRAAGDRNAAFAHAMTQYTFLNTMLLSTRLTFKDREIRCCLL